MEVVKSLEICGWAFVAGASSRSELQSDSTVRLQSKNVF